ncbi:hypothetical protein RGQ13_06600 [Thalassotalea psychrophila]|uniref:Uncharacterized protein n=1 Tax=Thalassotalea psychrophila TaxID=3065647 RepID=A0ABY9TXY2_9GAMM|nr:hypothetical protein RGQ13_06600 [Colwelliaceae bacterium SQ149]
MTSTNIPKWFTVVAVLALLWNLMGVMAYLQESGTTPATPIWVTMAFAFAVFGGALGCLLLILKRALAKIILIISLASVLVQMFHAYFISNAWEVFGPGGAIMPVMVIVVAIYLVWLSQMASQKSWIK